MVVMDFKHFTSLCFYNLKPWFCDLCFLLCIDWGMRFLTCVFSLSPRQAVFIQNLSSRPCFENSWKTSLLPHEILTHTWRCFCAQVELWVMWLLLINADPVIARADFNLHSSWNVCLIPAKHQPTPAQTASNPPCLSWKSPGIEYTIAACHHYQLQWPTHKKVDT